MSGGQRVRAARKGKSENISVGFYNQAGLSGFDRRFEFTLGGFAWGMNRSEGYSVSHRNISRIRGGRSSIGGKCHGQG